MLDPYFNKAYPLKHLKKAVYWPWGEYKVLRDANAVCFTCEDEKLLAQQSFKPYICHEEIVGLGTSAPNGNPDDLRHVFFQKFPELADRRLILYLSRVHPKKGCDILLDSFARAAHHNPSLHLVMAGPAATTDYRAQLERQAARLGLAGRITWTGMITGDLKWGAFFAADAYILPSHQENFGIAVAEALACGLPVLISNKVNIWREIQSDNAGLVADDTTEGTDSLLSRWLGLPDKQRDEMRIAAADCFLSRFEIHNAADHLIRVLECAVSSSTTNLSKRLYQTQ
jgi:glycosyltransferase involved in cell wall biosynthesis